MKYWNSNGIVKYFLTIKERRWYEIDHLFQYLSTYQYHYTSTLLKNNIPFTFPFKSPNKHDMFKIIFDLLDLQNSEIAKFTRDCANILIGTTLFAGLVCIIIITLASGTSPADQDNILGIITQICTWVGLFAILFYSIMMILNYTNIWKAIIIGTFAASTVGAFVVVEKSLKDYYLNRPKATTEISK